MTQPSSIQLAAIRSPAADDLRAAFRDYYSDRHVRARLLEYLGGPTLDRASCYYIANYEPSDLPWFHPRPVESLWSLADGELEIERSLWDRTSLLAHLDIEYVHFDRPWEAYADPEYMIGVQRPVVRAIEETLGDYGITPLRLLSGRGYHFVWRMPFDSVAFRELAAIGRHPESTTRMYQRPHRPCGAIVDGALGRAYSGLGLILEYLAHDVLRLSASTSSIPVQLTSVEVGPGSRNRSRGREIVSIDLSEYGDPIHRRTIRLPFGAYLKAHHLNGALPEPFAADLQPLVMIPMTDLQDRDGIRIMRDLNEARRLARKTSVEIPDRSTGTERLIARYKESTLAQFHDGFYARQPHPPEIWAKTYDLASMDAIPPCVRRTLEHPNDRLLKPAAIQHTVRVLLALGWHPRDISGLIRSKYERDYGWLIDRHFHDPALRADFYTRMFAGLIATSVDGLVDFNCQSTQEKRYCTNGDCAWNLLDFRDSLQARCEHERLAGRPFHGLFLSDEHSRMS